MTWFERRRRQRVRSHRFRVWEFWQQSGVQQRYLEKSFDDCDATFDRGRHGRSLALCRAWAEAFDLSNPKASQSVVLWSEGYGTGKTHLARAMLRWVLEASSPDTLRFLNPVHFTTAPAAMQGLGAARCWKEAADRENLRQRSTSMCAACRSWSWMT